MGAGRSRGVALQKAQDLEGATIATELVQGDAGVFLAARHRRERRVFVGATEGQAPTLADAIAK